MSPEQESYAAAWLAEMWPVCRELPAAERALERERAALQNGDETEPRTVRAGG